MTVEVDTLPYATIVLHSLKYPSKAIFGLLLGSKQGGKVKVTSCVPIAHEAAPLNPSLELVLTLVNDRHGNIVGVYFANENLLNSNLNPIATKLAQKVADQTHSQATIVQLVNSKLSSDCMKPCLVGHQKFEGSWQESNLVTPSNTLPTVSAAIQKKLYRELADFENHLDRPEMDFYNCQLANAILEVPY